MERIFAGVEPLDAKTDRILACSDTYPEPLAERIVPDGAIHLIFNLGDRPSGDRGADLACLAMGVTCEPTRIVLSGHVEQVCVRLRAGAAPAILGVPASVLTDQGVALDTLWGHAAGETLEQLHELPTAAARAAWLAQVLDERARRGHGAANARAAIEAMRRIAASGGRVRIRELAAALGVTDRRLQQLFHEHIGLSPKAACRLARFREVLVRRRREPARSWAELALDTGFYDQAHLANELKAFTGVTPRNLAESSDFGFLQDAAPTAA
ncbi:MAG: AraC family transcriptional regulator [Kofleriaceae bacterium]|nr:AraC family transcriptional regulator [Kofleriaceae bacterium]